MRNKGSTWHEVVPKHLRHRARTALKAASGVKPADESEGGGGWMKAFRSLRTSIPFYS